MIVFIHKHKNYRGEIVSDVTYTVHQDASLQEVMQEFRNFLLAMSFHPDTVDTYIEAD